MGVSGSGPEHPALLLELRDQRSPRLDETTCCLVARSSACGSGRHSPSMTRAADLVSATAWVAGLGKDLAHRTLVRLRGGGSPHGLGTVPPRKRNRSAGTQGAEALGQRRDHRRARSQRSRHEADPLARTDGADVLDQDIETVLLAAAAAHARATRLAPTPNSFDALGVMAVRSRSVSSVQPAGKKSDDVLQALWY